MTDNTRILDIERGEVRCLPGKRETAEKCRFCVHSKKFRVNGAWKISPARAYCSLCRTDEDADAVECDDLKGEGFRSILNIIS